MRAENDNIPRKLQVLDLFSGIGGFSLGLERTGGFETAAFCEIEPFPRRVLAKHWPEVKCYEDVRKLDALTLRRDGITIDVICGGFPCQDISDAGLRQGIKGERSGLWGEYARIIGELQPRFVIVENVAALLGRGLGDVLGDLAALRYDAEWHCIPASSAGSPQHRDRIWILSYPASSKERPSVARYCRSQINIGWANTSPQAGGFSGLHGWGDWHSEPKVSRVAHGFSSEVDEIKGLGNAVVPQIPQMIGHAILASVANDNKEHQRAA